MADTPEPDVSIPPAAATPSPVPSAPADPTEVKDSWLWIRDSKGHGSVTVTFVTVAFFVTTLAYVLSIVSKIGPLEIRPFDVSACSSYFIPLLTLYFGRKWTEAKHGPGSSPST